MYDAPGPYMSLYSSQQQPYWMAIVAAHISPTARFRCDVSISVLDCFCSWMFSVQPHLGIILFLNASSLEEFIDHWEVSEMQIGNNNWNFYFSL